VIQAAHELFLANGYAATTLKQIAERSKVALPTVYAVFGNKRDLLLAVFNAARLGTVSEGLGHEEEPVVEMLRHATPQGIAHQVRLTREGGAPVARIIAKASAADPHIARLWEASQTARYANMERVVKTMRKEGTLRKGVSHADAADKLWTLTSNELYELLVFERNWSPEKYEKWLADMISTTLVGRAAVSSRRK
jgi:AcrR family transcriptional regulator